MEKHIKKAIEKYQCTGCAYGSDTSCYEKSAKSFECEKHVAGTTILGIGRIFLGMPKGFDRLEFNDKTTIYVFDKFENCDWDYSKFNIPIWKHLNEHNHTLVRGVCPRTNFSWIHIFLENCMDKINCLEITKNDIDKMN